MSWGVEYSGHFHPVDIAGYPAASNLSYRFGERQRSGDAPLVARTQQRLVHRLYHL